MFSAVWSYEVKEQGLQFYVYRDKDEYKSCALKNRSISKYRQTFNWIPRWELHGYYFEPIGEQDDDITEGKYVTGTETNEKTRYASNHKWERFEYVLLPLDDLEWPLNENLSYKEVFVDVDTSIRIWRLDELWILLYTREDSREGAFDLYNDPLNMLYSAIGD